MAKSEFERRTRDITEEELKKRNARKKAIFEDEAPIENAPEPDPELGEQPTPEQIVKEPAGGLGKQPLGTVSPEQAELTRRGGAVLAEETSLGSLSALIGAFDPETGQEFKEYVEESKRKHPFLMTGIELLSPNPFSKFSKAGKAATAGQKMISELAPEVATSLAYQAKETGQVDPERLGWDVLIGKGLEKGMGKLLVGNQAKRRAKSLGFTRLKDAKRKIGDQDPEEFISDTMGTVEDMNLFQRGPVEFDSKRLKFKRQDLMGGEARGLVDLPSTGEMGDITLGKAFPPSPKEVASRLKKAKGSVNSRINKIIEERSAIPLSQRGIGDYTVDPDIKSGKVTQETVLEADDNAIMAIQNQLSLDDNVNQDEVEKSFRRLFGDDLQGEASLQDLNEEKKFLYDSLKWKGEPPSGEKLIARESLARSYKNILNEALGDTEIEKLNKAYEDLSVVSSPLAIDIMESVFEGSPLKKGAERASFLGGPVYRTLRAIEAMEESGMGTSAQIGQSLRESPGFSKYLRGAGARIAPMGPRSEQEEGSPVGVPYDRRREPQSVDRVRNLPFALQNTRLPRTTQGILENIPLVKAKVAQELPEMYPEVKRVLEHRPQDIDRLLPNLIQAVPELFEPDEYGRVDNKILDPAAKMRAIDEIYSDPDISNTERVEMVDRLMRTGKLEGYK